jgi:hypothetical protein
MKIRVKHYETEIVIDDVSSGEDYGLIYYNKQYIIELIKEISENIIKIQQGNK